MDAGAKVERELVRNIIDGIAHGQSVFRIPDSAWTETLSSELSTFAEVCGYCFNVSEQVPFHYPFFHELNDATECNQSHEIPFRAVTAEATLSL